MSALCFLVQVNRWKCGEKKWKEKREKISKNTKISTNCYLMPFYCFPLSFSPSGLASLRAFFHTLRRSFIGLMLPHIESDIHRRSQSKQLAGAEFGNFIHVLSLVHFYGDRRSLIARWSLPEAINLLHSGAALRFFVGSNRKFQFHNSGQQEWVLWSTFFITFPCHNYRVPH